MDVIKKNFNDLSRTPSDINEHLPTLSKYASDCDSVFETGVRGCVSSWALLNGLVSNQNGKLKRMCCNDISECNIDELKRAISIYNSEKTDAKVDLSYVWKNNLLLEFKEGERYDLVFIDTLHCYGQLRRELALFAPITNKYIIMHDTTIDEFRGEIYRSDLSYEKLLEWKRDTGFTDDTDILYGLSQAIDEFLQNNKEWEMLEKFSNNNGLTVLYKK